MLVIFGILFCFVFLNIIPVIFLVVIREMKMVDEDCVFYSINWSKMKKLSDS